MATPREIAFVLNAIEDPVFFAEEILGLHLWQLEKEILWSIRDNLETVVAACHGSGKSFTAAIAVLWWLYSRKPALALTTAPTDRQVKNVLWKEIGTLFDNALVKLPGTLFKIPRLEVDRDHFAFGFSADHPDNAQGIHARNIIVVVDEASGVQDPEMWRALKSNTAGGEARLVVQGNPLDPTSQFFSELSRAGKGSWSIGAYDTPNFTETGITEDDMLAGRWKDKADDLPFPDLITPRYVAEVIEDDGYDSPTYVARVRGEFPQSATDALIPLWAIDRAVQKWLHFQESPDDAPIRPEGPLELGVDVADMGDDQSVRCIHQGDYVYEFRAQPFEGPPETTGRIIQEDFTELPEIVVVKVDAIGVGNEVANRLSEQDYPVVAFVASERALDPDQFPNLRSESWWGLRLRFLDGAIALPPSRRVIQELSAIRWKLNARGQRQVEPKDETKKRIHRSPDYADALMMSFANVSRESGILMTRNPDTGRRPPPDLGMLITRR